MLYVDKDKQIHEVILEFTSLERITGNSVVELH